MQRIVPKPGQESVWDYPRPPRLERVPHRIRVIFNNVVLADSNQALRMLETSHPPVYYVPPDDITMEFLTHVARSTYCEWKGHAIYYTVQLGCRRAEQAAWAYPEPRPAYADLKDHLAFYPSKMDACYVGDEKVEAQPGDFYGGWITSNIVGPFKGSPGTWGW